MTHLSSFLRNKHGNVILIFALVLPVFILVGGGAVSLSQRNTVKSTMQNAADSAALAGMALPEGTSSDEREATARDYMRNNVADDFLGTNFKNVKHVAVTASEERVTVTAEAGVKALFGFMGGPEGYPIHVTSSAVPNMKQIPGAIDLVIGLDGGCGLEKGGKFSSIREAYRNLLNQIASRPNQQVYAAGVWSAYHNNFWANLQFDVNYLNSNLSHVANFVAGRPDTADNGSSMGNVIIDMYNALAANHSDTRDPKILAKRKTIGVIFQGAHNAENTEAATYSQCGSLTSSLDGVYVFASSGTQNTGGNCTNKSFSPDSSFPSSPAPAIRTCGKIFNDPENPAFASIPEYQVISAGSLPGSMTNLANAIGNFKTTIRAGARLEQ